MCHISYKKCNSKDRDDNHDTGRYRGPACALCNLSYKQQNIIAVVIHNGSGYDNSPIF